MPSIRKYVFGAVNATAEATKPVAQPIANWGNKIATAAKEGAQMGTESTGKAKAKREAKKAGRQIQRQVKKAQREKEVAEREKHDQLLQQLFTAQGNLEDSNALKEILESAKKDKS